MTLMRIIVLIGFISFTISNVFAQVEVGKQAPPISIDKWIDNPHVDPKGIEGNAIVLDFWFTHCAPCVYTIPHLNDLSEMYQNDSIVFIGITYENERDVQNFLSKKRMLLNVGSDTTYTTMKAYEIEGYPTTFLIDKDGLLRWRGHPTHLNTDLIDALLDKKYYPEVEGDQGISMTTSNSDIGKSVTYPISVSKNDYMNVASGWKSDAGELSIVNQSLADVMALLLQKSQSRISVADTNKYDIRFKIPNDLPQSEVRGAIIKSLLNELSLAIKSRPEHLNGFELTVSNDSLLAHNALNPSKVYRNKKTSTNQTFWMGEGVQLSDLVLEIENRFGTYVYDRTNIFGFFELKFPFANLDNARSYLLETYGLELVPTLIDVEITEIIHNHH